MVDLKSYCTVAKTHRDETSEVTDLSPGSSRSDNVRHGTPETDTHPSGSRPRDEMTACDQVLHSDIELG